jgi:transposase
MEEEAAKKKALIEVVNRDQMGWVAMDVERLISEDHPARAIWAFVERLDLSRFEQQIGSTEELGGRPAKGPQLLISLWIYAYSLGIGQAREISRRCEYDPPFQWLTGLRVVNYHTLADFRVGHQAALDQLFTQVLGLLSAEGLITLDQVTQDGTKIKALASGKSFHREDTIRKHLARARQQVEAMGDPSREGESQQRQQARVRARRERTQRLEDALAELAKLGKTKSGEEERRVSTSDPEARRMKQADGGYAPNYNVQISTDMAYGMIVDVAVAQAGNDSHQLLPAVARIEQRLQEKPQAMVADGDYTNRKNIEGMAERQVEFVGSLRREAEEDQGRWSASTFRYEAEGNLYLCPAGKTLKFEGCHPKGDDAERYSYRASWEDCQNCPHKLQCCPRNEKAGRGLIRILDSAAMTAFRQKMATPQGQAQYRHRGPVAEFCHAWIKSKLGLRQFHVCGKVKAQLEMLWACLTYNLQQWIRLKRLAAVPLAS